MADYQVVCIECGHVWQPAYHSPLWWKALQRAQQGYLDALPVKCGCTPEVKEPHAPYRVIGYTDMCEDFDLPFHSLVQAAKRYIELAQGGMSTVLFVDTNRPQSKIASRLRELAW